MIMNHLNENSKDLYIDMISKDPGAWDFINYLKNNKITIVDRDIALASLKKNGQVLG